MKALLIDGLNLIRRIYAAVPVDTASAKADDADTRDHIAGVIQSSCSSLKRALNFHNPSHALLVLEYGGKSWRHQIFPEYKKNRSPMPADLRDSLPDFESAFSDIGVNSFHLTGFEADDIIATLASKISSHDGNVVVLSTDRIQCQLIDSRIRVYDHFAGQYLDESYIENRFGVNPHQIVEMLALAGDSSLSIPGVKSVGQKTAAKLLARHGNLDQLFSHLDDIGGKLGSNLESGMDDALIARTLFRLKTDIDLGINLSQFRYSSRE
jgi:5'-3' exonuclease